jgi:hypothetical protein
VRDAATAHVLAYEKGESDQRYFVTNGNFAWQEVWIIIIYFVLTLSLSLFFFLFTLFNRIITGG